MDTLNPASQIGLTIANTYKLIRVLGEGSFAVVFLGRNVYSGEQVAVKCLYKQGLTKHQINLQREEVFILEKLRGHPNIVNLLQSVETDHHLYLVLEYCEIDLFDSIMKRPFDSKLALKLFTQLANAVAACHDLGIYHRDLKPENVLISSLRSPVIKLTDFGLSTTEYLSSEYGCGSVRYMAPECLKPENKKTSQPYVSPANDVWSLGIILINMLTGKNPWVQPHQNDKHFRAHLLSRQGSIDSFRQQFNFSDSFCQILRMVFQMQPSTRPTVRQFLSMVQQLPTFFHVNNSIAPVKYTPPQKQNGMLTPSSLPFQGFHGNTQMLPGTPESFKEPLAWKQVDRKSDDLMFEMELDNTIF